MVYRIYKRGDRAVKCNQAELWSGHSAALFVCNDMVGQPIPYAITWSLLQVGNELCYSSHKRKDVG
jgi:hypothetical protein